jgi:hypothetical protein
VSRVGGGDVMIMTMAIGMSMRNHMSKVLAICN